MNKNLIKSIFVALAIVASSAPGWAQTFVQQLGYDAPDGDRITGFIYQSKDTAKDAPIAILMHGLTGSSLYWLAADNFAHGDDVTAMLLARGYRVVALDARVHGARRRDKKPMELVMAARTGDTQAYQGMISDTVGDYQFLLNRLMKNFKDTKHVLVVGYSMGAQMGTLLAAQDKRVTHLATMVPPAVRNVPEVSPINFAPNVHVPWLLVTATKDEFSSRAQNAELIAASGQTLTNVSFDSGHALPQSYVGAIESWLNGQN